MGGAIAVYANCVSAQMIPLIPDGTLPTNSTFKLEENTRTIEGGTKVGSNLFHSFKQFSVPIGSTAYFNNALDIQNIISRVTGGSRSEIDGLIYANGTANLFLINPSGIIFGKNASLNIGGSFVATTANAIAFGDRGIFSATNSESSPSLLTVNPSALLFNQINQNAVIQNNSVALAEIYPPSFDAFGLRVPDGIRVPDGKSLLLVGGNVSMDRGQLNAFGGRVELGGLAEPGNVALGVDGDNLSLIFPDNVARASVYLTNQAGVSVNGAGGGNIAVNARDIEILGGSILFAGIKSQQGSNAQGGDINISASKVTVSGGSTKSPSLISTAGPGMTGNLTISTTELHILDGGWVIAGISGDLPGGNLIVNHAELVEIKGTSPLTNFPSLLATGTQGSGKSGNIYINTTKLKVSDGGIVTVGTSNSGHGGDLFIDATDSVEFVGTSKQGLSASEIEYLIGLGGFAVLKFVEDRPFPSGVISGTSNTGDAGNLTIKTGRLLIQGGAQASVSTIFNGDKPGSAGSLNVTASSIELSGTYLESTKLSDIVGPSLLTSAVGEGSTGKGGNITVNTNSLTINNGAALAVSSTGLGPAGDLTVKANSIIYLNNTGKITADTTAGGGNIVVRSPLLLLRNQSSITTDAKGAGIPGGNITIDAKDGFIIAVPEENSDISADSANFSGGKVNITSEKIFGIERRNTRTPKSDITAKGGRPDLNGLVELNTANIDPSSGLVELPTVPVDTHIAQGCYSPGYAQSSFKITGRGGLPPNPREAFSGNTIRAEWATFSSSNDSNFQQTVKENSPISTPPAPIVEATGWGTNTKGEIAGKYP